jgi:hypothetical protein
MLYLSLLRNLEGIELMPLDGAGKPMMAWRQADGVQDCPATGCSRWALPKKKR